MLGTILVYDNMVNHFVAMKPSWSINMRGARIVWTKMRNHKIQSRLRQLVCFQILGWMRIWGETQLNLKLAHIIGFYCIILICLSHLVWSHAKFFSYLDYIKLNEHQQYDLVVSMNSQKQGITVLRCWTW